MASSSQGRGVPLVVPSAARTSTGSVVLEITRLREESEAIRKKLTEYESRIDSLERTKVDMRHLITSAVAQLDLQTKRNSQLESALRVVVAAVGVRLPPGILSALPPGGGTSADPPGDAIVSVLPQGTDGQPIHATNEGVPGGTTSVVVGTTGASRARTNGQPIEAIVGKAARQCLFAMYGCDHLRHYEDLCYPQVEKTHSSWPTKDGRPLLRFDFKETYNSKINKESFADWVTYTKRHGSTHLPEATAALTRASDTAISSQCRIKFDYFKREWARKKKNLETGELASVLGVRKRGNDGEDDDDEYAGASVDVGEFGGEETRENGQDVDGETRGVPACVLPPYPSTDKKELRS
ncbi:hypothetical protein BDV93DRAFT_566274 [Ceratobasidium sp. AG-I]|nr:hypothetical protein BDV93DRAFT_566274 [Ceratobasidium sp. AG-I]